MDDLVNIGKTGRPHGTKGALTLHVSKDIDWEHLDALFLEIQNDFVPFLIEEIDFVGKKIVVKLENISSMNDSKKLTNCNVWIPKQLVIEEEFDEYLGYKVIDVNHQNFFIGIIEEIITSNQLVWLKVKSNKTENSILLPYNTQLIEKISKSDKIIYYKAIEGMY